MSNQPIQFLSVPDILRIHRYAMRDQRGDPTVRDLGLLDSAMAMPRQQFGGEFLHPDIPSMAAAYAFHICKNHPFVDGNKRAATAAMLMFLSDNGWSYDATADEAEPVILGLAAGELDKGPLTDWLRRMCHEKPSIELRVFFERLGFDQFVQVHNALTKTGGTNFQELRATMTEAIKAIPFLETWFKYIAVLSQDPKTDPNLMQSAVESSLTIGALFRLAEDQGYEW